MTQGGTTTNTVYVGNVEEVAITGGTATTTAYYYAAGKPIGLAVNGAISYLASDGLGSANVMLNGSGSATASQLFAPYGTVRYSSGVMPTRYGFTGQRSDAASGLDYYGARYYDPLAGQFMSGDSVIPGGGFELWGLSRYAYVGGNPVIRVDPSGHSIQCPDGGCGGDPPPPPPPIDPDPCGGLCDPGGNGGGGGGGDNGGPSVDPGPGGSGGGGPSSAAGSDNGAPRLAPAPRVGSLSIRVISATCLQVNGHEVGACGPTSGNFALSPDYGLCLAIAQCESYDSEGISLSGFFFSNGGGSPDTEAGQAEEQTAESDSTAATGPKAGSVGGPGAGNRYIPQSIKDTELEATSGVCRFCGQQTSDLPGPTRLEWDHAQPFSRGGDSTIDNIQALCRSCNRIKWAMTSQEFADQIFRWIRNIAG